MATSKPVWGIDLGQRSLKALRLRLAGDKVEVLDHVYIEHARILSQPDADRAALIAETMKKFPDQHDLARETLIVAVPGQHTLARFTKLPPVDKKKIPEIVKYEAQQQIPFDMEEVIWDYQVFQDPEAMETEVGIFAMRRELLREHLYFLTSLNLEPATVQSSPLALYNALKYDGLCGGGAVTILDIGAQNTDLIVVDGDSLWTRNIPIGGNNFTEALLKTFKLSFNKAERLKRDAQKHKYARQIFQAMRPVFADLVAEIQRSIGFFTSSRRGVKLSRIIAMGNAFKLPGMVKFVQQNLGMEVVRPTTFSKLSVSEAPRAPELIDQLLSFGVAYGLGLQGLGLSQITSNLIPVAIQKQVVWRKKSPWFYGAAACLLLSAGIVWGRSLVDRSAVEKAGGGGSGAGRPVATVEDAYEIVENGPGTALSARPRAGTVLNAGRKLRNALNEELHKNDDLLQAAKQLVELQSGQLVWPTVLDLIHSALPAPDEELAKALAEGPEAYKQLIDGDKQKYKRGQREQIFIHQFDAEYAQDVMALYYERRKQGVPSPGSLDNRGTASARPLNLRGFVIHLGLRTPNQRGYGFVNETFLNNLRKATSDEVDVYFDYFYPQRIERVGESQMGPGLASRSRRPQAWSERSWARSGSDGEFRTVDETAKDPVTGESIENDREIDIIFVAVLGKESEETGPASPDVHRGPSDLLEDD